MILESILATLIPAGVDLLKTTLGGVSRKWFGLSVDDQIKLAASDVQRLQALALLDNPYGIPAQWVVNLRASFRYIGAGASILAGILMLLTVPEAQETAASLISIPFAFIFGERMYLAISGKQK